jgi:hypothetical protein
MLRARIIDRPHKLARGLLCRLTASRGNFGAEEADVIEVGGVAEIPSRMAIRDVRRGAGAP